LKEFQVTIRSVDPKVEIIFTISFHLSAHPCLRGSACFRLIFKTFFILDDFIKNMLPIFVKSVILDTSINSKRA